jgi:hypothetical protein
MEFSHNIYVGIFDISIFLIHIGTWYLGIHDNNGLKDEYLTYFKVGSFPLPSI